MAAATALALTMAVLVAVVVAGGGGGYGWGCSSGSGCGSGGGRQACSGRVGPRLHLQLHSVRGCHGAARGGQCAAARSKACAAIEAAAKHVCDDLTKVYQLTAAGRVVEGGYARMQYTSDCATLRACIHEGSAKHGVEAPW